MIEALGGLDLQQAAVVDCLQAGGRFDFAMFGMKCRRLGHPRTVGRATNATLTVHIIHLIG